MACIKQIERSATVAFCPSANLLAAGTVAGAIDMSFSTNSVLEVFGLDFSTGSAPPVLVGSVPVPERFNRIAWAPRAPESPLPYGILAGGLADGTVCVWDPSAMIDRTGKSDRPPLLSKMQKHTGPVKGLDFNPYTPNLLASGAADSDICIWDLANPAQPSLYPALKGAQGPGQPAPGSEITFVSWNRKVQHILASSLANGTTVVWDLKRQRPVISFRDPNSPRRCSVLQWNPEVATQLIVASDDDRSPTLQMWDLRNSVSPLKEFCSHTKGVLSMAWSPHDASLLLSSAKDNRTICWDVHSADIVCELPAGSNWDFDVQWSPLLPGVFSTSSFDGKVGVCNLLCCTASSTAETVNADFTVSTVVTGHPIPLTKAPTWMRRTCGATFGFGGKLVAFNNHKSQVQDASGQTRPVEKSVISISQVITEPDLVVRSESFEKAIAGGEKGTLKEYCVSKSQTSQDAEGETWSFLSILFDDDARRQLLIRLGFEDVLKTAQQEAADAVAAGVENLAIDGKPTIEVPGYDQVDDPDFFDKLPEQGINLDAITSPVGAPEEPAVENGVPEQHGELEDEIQSALFVGNYDSAVESCFKAGRHADALLIANICGSELYKKAMCRFMKLHPRPYMQIVSAMMENDYMALVKTRPVARWKETLAVLATYTGSDQWATLCEALADRLAAAGQQHAASLCYICAGSVDKAVAYWSKTVQSARLPGLDTLQSVIEKAVILGLATNNKKASSSLSELVTSYASILVAQGRMATALDYLDLVPGEASTTVAVLKDRIYRSGAELPATMHVPPFPFIKEDVVPSADAAKAVSTAAAPAAASNQYAGYNNYQYQQPAQPQQPAANAYQPQQPAYPSAYAPQTTPAYPASAVAQQPAYSATPATRPFSAAPTSFPTAQPSYPAAQAAPSFPTQPASNPPANPYYPAPTAQQPQHQFAHPQMAPVNTGAPYGQSDNMYQVKRGSLGGLTATPNLPSTPVQGQSTSTPFTHSPSPLGQSSSGGYGQPQPAAHNVATVQPTFFVPTAPANPPAVPVPAAHYAPASAPVAAPSAAPVAAAPVSQPKPAAPAGPPAHVAITNVDTSKVPADQQKIVASLTNLYNSCMPMANNPAKKREMDDNSKRLGQLLWKLNNGDVSGSVIPKLAQLCEAIDAQKWHDANQIQVQMTTTDWDECGFWLSVVKRLIKTRQTNF